MVKKKGEGKEEKQKPGGKEEKKQQQQQKLHISCKKHENKMLVDLRVICLHLFKYYDLEMVDKQQVII